MEHALEAVPNFSEGRSAETIAALRDALAAHACVLDVHSDVDHNRSVFTLGGEGSALVEALLAGIACAKERIDLRRHQGVHPRIGAADVVPVVAVWPEQMDDAKATASRLAQRVADELELAVFLYGELAPEMRPAMLRRDGLDALRRRVEAGELKPDLGPSRLDPAVGCVLVGARTPLVAFNVDLGTDELAVAREIAAVVRETGGGFPGVRALGFSLTSRGLVQVSMNVEDWRRAPLDQIVVRIEAEAAARGVAVAGAELVGLLPQGAAAAGAEALRLPQLTDDQLLELALTRLGS